MKTSIKSLTRKFPSQKNQLIQNPKTSEKEVKVRGFQTNNQLTS